MNDVTSDCRLFVDEIAIYQGSSATLSISGSSENRCQPMKSAVYGNFAKMNLMNGCDLVRLQIRPTHENLGVAGSNHVKVNGNR